MVVNSGHYHVHPFWEYCMYCIEQLEEWAKSQNELERERAFQRELAQDAKAANLRMDMDEFEWVLLTPDREGWAALEAEYAELLHRGHPQDATDHS